MQPHHAGVKYTPLLPPPYRLAYYWTWASCKSTCRPPPSSRISASLTTTLVHLLSFLNFLILSLHFWYSNCSLACLLYFSYCMLLIVYVLSHCSTCELRKQTSVLIAFSWSPFTLHAFWSTDNAYFNPRLPITHFLTSGAHRCELTDIPPLTCYLDGNCLCSLRDWHDTPTRIC